METQRPLTRRDALSRLMMAGLTSGVGAYLYGSRLERHVITTERVVMHLPDLPDELVGFKIVQLSDLHLRPVTMPETIEKAVSVANALEPDLTVITGDFITERGNDSEELGGLLRSLKAGHGVFGVLGNHDCWHQPWKVTRDMNAAGVQMLVNAGSEINVRGSKLWLGGIDSVWAGRPELKKCLPRDPRQPTVLLAHEPDYADVVMGENHPLIQLSGHSHGGQVRVPLLGPPVTVTWGKKYLQGAFRVGQVRLYVNRGIGCTGRGVRFACPPEVTEITLARELAGQV